jgi:hypothetical protein
MNKPIQTRPGWRKSRHSGGGNDCVEVDEKLTGIADTKDKTHSAVMFSGPAAVRALFAHLRQAA